VRRDPDQREARDLGNEASTFTCWRALAGIDGYSAEPGSCTSATPPRSFTAHKPAVPSSSSAQQEHRLQQQRIETGARRTP
jgi:hypothetical protein